MKLKDKYVLVLENVLRGYILNTFTNKFVALVETKRPDLEFDDCKELVRLANIQSNIESGLNTFGWRLSTVLDCVVWHGECGLDWQLSNPETPAENEMVYCPKCGKKLEVSE